VSEFTLFRSDPVSGVQSGESNIIVEAFEKLGIPLAIVDPTETASAFVAPVGAKDAALGAFAPVYDGPALLGRLLGLGCAFEKPSISSAVVRIPEGIFYLYAESWSEICLRERHVPRAKRGHDLMVAGLRRLQPPWTLIHAEFVPGALHFYARRERREIDHYGWSYLIFRLGRTEDSVLPHRSA